MFLMKSDGVSEEVVASMLRIGLWLILGLCVVGIGIFLWKTSESQVEVKVVKEQRGVREAESVIVVDVEWEVVRPGVYKVSKGARINDVIEVAGGFSEHADIDWVNVNINKAAVIDDGYKLYVPGREAVKSDVNLYKKESVVNINVASLEQLEALPGVCPATAEKIISARPYVNIDDLVKKKVISAKLYADIKEKLSL